MSQMPEVAFASCLGQAKKYKVARIRDDPEPHRQGVFLQNRIGQETVNDYSK